MRHRKLIRDLEVEEPSAELNFNTQILDPDQFKTSFQILQLQKAIENDQQLLTINKSKLELYQKEAANLENELYKGPGGAIMEQYQTPKYSFEKYEEKVNSEMNRLQSMIMAKLREKIREAMVQTFTVGKSQSEFQAEQKQEGLLALQRYQSGVLRAQLCQPISMGTSLMQQRGMSSRLTSGQKKRKLMEVTMEKEENKEILNFKRASTSDVNHMIMQPKREDIHRIIFKAAKVSEVTL